MKFRFAVGVLAGVFSSLAAGGCGDTRINYNYMYTLKGADACTTGEQTFESLAAMCTALQSDSVNNSCDLPDRMTFFVAQKCPGVFVEAP